jgi:pimeloyl-ACP methyl ester carboxylesterase
LFTVQFLLPIFNIHAHLNNLKFSLKGYQFIVYTSLLKNFTEGKELQVALPNGNTPLLLYTPPKKEVGLIISFTGFSLNGFRDKRITAVNNAFAKLGYRVITPQIKEIDALRINPQSIEEVKEIILAIMADPSLNPNQFCPAVFAPSFTAGIAALAVAQLPKPTVSAMCLLGSFTDFESTIDFALSNEENLDDYGMHILMKNFLRYQIGRNPEIEALVQTALEDNGLKRPQPLLPSLLAQTMPQNRELYHKLRNDTAFRRETILEAWSKIPDADTWKAKLNLAKHAHLISCPVAIIHGKDDNVIPAEQSVLLHALMQKYNPNVHLEISEILDHGDLKLGFKIVKEVAHLAKAFNFFMAHIK